MAAGVNDTSITLYHVPFDNTYKDVVFYFNDREDQLEYFNTQLYKWEIGKDSHANFMFIDGESNTGKHTKVKIPYGAEKIAQYNYMIYNNNEDSYGEDADKLSYKFCFITNVEYINHDCCEATIELDVFQTYMFQYEVLPCTIERETLSKFNDIDSYCREPDYMPCAADDVRSISTITTNVDYLPYVVVSDAYMKLQQYEPDEWYTHGFNTGGTRYPFTIIVVDSPSDIESIKYSIEHTDKNVSDIIISCGAVSKSVVPRKCIIADDFGTTTHVYEAFGVRDFDVIKWSDLQKQTTFDVARPTSLYDENRTEYVPHNHKLLCAPYTTANLTLLGRNIPLDFAKASGSAGETKKISLKLKYDFEDKFMCTAIVQGYNGTPSLTENYDYTFNIPVATTFPMTADSYLEWWNSNKASFYTKETAAAIGILGSAIMSMVGAATGNALATVGGVAGVLGSAASVATTAGTQMDMQRTEHTMALGDMGTDTMLVANYLYPKCYVKQIDMDYVKKVDNYFSVYGYRTNRHGRPNMWSRTKWDYVKTKDFRIRDLTTKPYMTTEQQKKLASIFNNGVTIWHNAYVGDYGDYGQS